MKRVLLIILLHLSLFFLVFAYQAQASEEEWKIDRYESLVFARVYGEVIHGDSLNFFINSKDICENVWHNFTFYTFEQPGDIKQLLQKKNFRPQKFIPLTKKYFQSNLLLTLSFFIPCFSN